MARIRVARRTSGGGPGPRVDGHRPGHRAVRTKDVHRAHRVAARLRAGTVWINAYRVVAPSVPFGGFGAGGLGRENGVAGLDEYLEDKSVWVEPTGGTRGPFTLG